MFYKCSYNILVDLLIPIHAFCISCLSLFYFFLSWFYNKQHFALNYFTCFYKWLSYVVGTLISNGRPIYRQRMRNEGLLWDGHVGGTRDWIFWLKIDGAYRAAIIVLVLEMVVKSWRLGLPNVTILVYYDLSMAILIISNTKFYFNKCSINY